MEKGTNQIKCTLTKTDVNVGRIRIPAEFKKRFSGYQNVTIKNHDYNIFDHGSTIYITGFTKLHKDNKAQIGMCIILKHIDKNHYDIEYRDETACLNKKNICKDTPNVAPNSILIDVDKSHTDVVTGIVAEVLDKMENSYKGILIDQEYLPTRNKIGFTERNLTFYFCHHYLEVRHHNISNIIVWQEMPLESDKNHDNKRQHIDSIIIDKQEHDIDIFYIEAKRVYDSSFVMGEECSLKSDFDRIINNCSLLPGYNELTSDRYKNVHHYVVLLAGLEIFENQRESTKTNKIKELEVFKQTYFNEKTQNDIIFIGGIKGSTDKQTSTDKPVSQYEIHAFYKEITNDTTE